MSRKLADIELSAQIMTADEVLSSLATKMDKEYALTDSYPIEGCGLVRNIPSSNYNSKYPNIIGFKKGLGYIEDGSVHTRIEGKRFYSIICIDQDTWDGNTTKMWYAVSGREHPIRLYQSDDGKNWNIIKTFQYGPEAEHITATYTEVIYDDVNKNLIVHASAGYKTDVVPPSSSNYKEYFWYSNDLINWKVVQTDENYQPKTSGGRFIDFGIAAMTAFKGKVYCVHNYTDYMNVLGYQDGKYVFERHSKIFNTDSTDTNYTIPGLMQSNGRYIVTATQLFINYSDNIKPSVFAYSSDGENWKTIYLDRNYNAIVRSIAFDGDDVYFGCYSPEGRIYKFNLDSEYTDSIQPLFKAKDIIGGNNVVVNAIQVSDNDITIATDSDNAGIYKISKDGNLINRINNTINKKQLTLYTFENIRKEISKLPEDATIQDIINIFK